MLVSSTEIQNNFGRYLEMASGEEVIITKNGTAVARLVGIRLHEKSLSERLRGILPPDTDDDAVKAERMSRH